jgi:hypothetical protein
MRNEVTAAVYQFEGRDAALRVLNWVQRHAASRIFGRDAFHPRPISNCFTSASWRLSVRIFHMVRS